jgi:hypothetical protein
MIYVVEGTSDCPCGFVPEVYPNLREAAMMLVVYNSNNKGGFTINRYNTLQDFTATLDDGDHFRLIEY